MKYSTNITLDILQICCSAISKQFCFIFCPSAAFKFDLAKVAVEFEEFMIVHLLSDVAMDLASRTKQHLRIFFQAVPFSLTTIGIGNYLKVIKPKSIYSIMEGSHTERAGSNLYIHNIKARTMYAILA